MIQIGTVMTKRVVTTSETRSVRDAARLMNRNGIGCIVVRRGRRVVGMLTERDVLRLVASGKHPEKTPVKQAMTSPVVVADPDQDFEDAVKLMVVHNIKKLPVLKGSRLVGIVTLTDFARVGPVFQEAMQKALTQASQPVKEKFQKFATEPPAEMYA